MPQQRYPFKFLDAYDHDDTDIFFGRDEEVDALYTMAFQSNMLLVYGASGTGKTSLINCGLASRFQSHDWLDLTIRRGSDLNDSLHRELDAAAGDATVNADAAIDWFADEEDTATATVARTELTDQLNAIFQRHFRPIYLLFDQFEELFVLGTADEQARFIETVQEIASVELPVKLIFIIREEYLGHLFDFERSVPQLLRKKLRIEPMNLDKVRQVIEGAAALPGSLISLEAGREMEIVEGIFSKIRGDANSLTIQLPFLQVFLDKLYLHITQDESRRTPATFTVAALEGIGDIGDVLRDFLEEQARRIQTELAADHSSDWPDAAIWRILSPLATLEGTKEPLSVEALLRRVPDLPPDAVRQSLQALEDRRILRFDENQGLYEVAHDSLAQRIAERRTDEEIALLEIRRLIKGQAALQEDARELFSAKQLDFIEPYLDKLTLTAEEQTLLRESHTAVAAQREAEERAARAKRRRLQRSIVVLALFSAAMIVLAIWAFGQKRAADSSADAARVSEAAAERALANLKQEQAIAYARELEAFGDSYQDLGKTGFACDSYRAGIDSLRVLDQFETIDVYLELSDKVAAICQ